MTERDEFNLSEMRDGWEVHYVVPRPGKDPGAGRNEHAAARIVRVNNRKTGSANLEVEGKIIKGVRYDGRRSPGTWHRKTVD